ncbi:MAG: hypothetical protein QNL12_01605 [Acidimicrobiia bacterium]|nr:hypothetical protein [Acidimicrobiia bacterium]MDX2465981.1 hypothetical protein [Acidimicrobiia bacterium]
MSIFVKAFRHVAEDMGVPRTVVTRHPMGRTMGAPGDTDRHSAVLEAAFALLEKASEGGIVTEFTDPFRPGRSESK